MFFAPIARTRAVSPAFRSFDRNFERFVNDAFTANAARGAQVAQDDKAWTLSLDVPGLAREDLTVLSAIQRQDRTLAQDPEGRVRACARATRARRRAANRGGILDALQRGASAFGDRVRDAEGQVGGSGRSDRQRPGPQAGGGTGAASRGATADCHGRDARASAGRHARASGD